MNHILNIDEHPNNEEDIFSTTPIDDLFLKNTTRLLTSDALLTISFIDRVSFNNVQSNIHSLFVSINDTEPLPQSSKAVISLETDHDNSKKSHLEDTTPIFSVYDTTIEQDYQKQEDTISLEEKVQQELLLSPYKKSFHEYMLPSHNSITLTTSIEQSSCIHKDFIESHPQNNNTTVNISPPNIVVKQEERTASPDTEISSIRTRLSFIEEVLLANKQQEQREQQEQEYRMRKRSLLQQSQSSSIKNIQDTDSSNESSSNIRLPDISYCLYPDDDPIL